MTQPLVGAPLWRRFAAMIYDGLILLAISMAYGGLVTGIGAALGLNNNEQDYQPMFAAGGTGELVIIGWILTLAGFYVWFWHRSGQTVGMRAWRLQLVDISTDRPPSMIRCCQRAAWGVLSLLLAGIGYWYRFISPTGQCLHDNLTQTNVLLRPKNKQP